MNREKFKQVVGSFCALTVDEFISGYEIKFNLESEADLTAEITIPMPYNVDKYRTFNIALANPYTPAIHVEEADIYISLDADGFYYWLWNEAEAELAKS